MTSVYDVGQTSVPADVLDVVLYVRRPTRRQELTRTDVLASTSMCLLRSWYQLATRLRSRSGSIKTRIRLSTSPSLFKSESVQSMRRGSPNTSSRRVGGPVGSRWIGVGTILVGNWRCRRCQQLAPVNRRPPIPDLTSRYWHWWRGWHGRHAQPMPYDGEEDVPVPCRDKEMWRIGRTCWRGGRIGTFNKMGFSFPSYTNNCYFSVCVAICYRPTLVAW